MMHKQPASTGDETNKDVEGGTREEGMNSSQ